MTGRESIMEWPYSLVGEGRSYDASPDGRRFLAVKLGTGDAEGDTSRPEITVALNWRQKLESLEPSN